MNKSIPIGLFIAADEDKCSHEQSLKDMVAMGEMLQFFKIYPFYDHRTMIFKNDDEFYSDILTYLASPHPDDIEKPGLGFDNTESYGD